ncbi:unnamed protein product, partial [Urochloa humidicola]
TEIDRLSSIVGHRRINSRPWVSSLTTQHQHSIHVLTRYAASRPTLTMAFRVSSTGLVVMCLASLLVSSFAKEGSGGNADAGRNMTSGGLVDADDYPPTYGVPTYGAVNRITARGILVTFCCFFSFLFFSETLSSTPKYISK